MQIRSLMGSNQTREPQGCLSEVQLQGSEGLQYPSEALHK